MQRCKCCNGLGTQRNTNTGLVVKCPECRGTGYWEEYTNLTYWSAKPRMQVTC